MILLETEGFKVDHKQSKLLEYAKVKRFELFLFFFFPVDKSLIFSK